MKKLCLLNEYDKRFFVFQNFKITKKDISIHFGEEQTSFQGDIYCWDVDEGSFEYLSQQNKNILIPKHLKGLFNSAVYISDILRNIHFIVPFSKYEEVKDYECSYVGFTDKFIYAILGSGKTIEKHIFEIEKDFTEKEKRMLKKEAEIKMIVSLEDLFEFLGFLCRPEPAYKSYCLYFDIKNFYEVISTWKSAYRKALVKYHP